MAALQYVDIPGYTAILFRRTYADLALPGALMDRFVEWIKEYDEIGWNGNNFTATFPSGARVTFGYLNNVNDFLRYKSAEFQFVGMDEVTEIRENDYRYLFSRLRRPGLGKLSQVPLRMRCASNPAPNWVRQRFIVEGKEKGRIFVPSLLQDNPGVDHKSYLSMLDELDPVTRAQLAEGDWWATQLGSMFLRENFEVIEADEIPIMKAPKAVRMWDLAGTKPSPTNSDPDWTVGVLMVYDDGMTYILDVKRIRENPDKVEELVADTAREDGLAVAIRVEKEPGQSGKSQIMHYGKNIVPGYDFDEIQPSGDKEVRARPLASAVRRGMVKLLQGPWVTDYLDEMSAFDPPHSTIHDDQVDASSHAYGVVTGITGKVRGKVHIIV